MDMCVCVCVYFSRSFIGTMRVRGEGRRLCHKKGFEEIDVFGGCVCRLDIQVHVF